MAMKLFIFCTIISSMRLIAVSRKRPGSSGDKFGFMLRGANGRMTNADGISLAFGISLALLMGMPRCGAPCPVHPSGSTVSRAGALAPEDLNAAYRPRGRHPSARLARGGIPRPQPLGRAVHFPDAESALPERTRALLLYRYYRYRRLPEAQWAAKQAGYKGAMYPWQSGSHGQEEGQVVHFNPVSGRWIPDDTRLQRHVNAAVADNIWQYYQATADMEFLSLHGAEMILFILNEAAVFRLRGKRGTGCLFVAFISCRPYVRPPKLTLRRG
jgi:Glycosyl hydrolase family 65 central catalytic domain